MNKKELVGLIVKDSSLGKNKVVGIRLPIKLVQKLKLHDVDIAASCRSWLERYIETVEDS